MISFCFITNPTNNQIRGITDLYRKAGWWSANRDDNPELVRKIVAGSHNFLVAMVSNNIIGMGRSISDSISDAYIQDVTVHPFFQKKGIGRMIVNSIVKSLEKEGFAWIGLIAERNSSRFYERCGFLKMSDSVPMIRRPQ